jgi:hypothetical protein
MSDNPTRTIQNGSRWQKPQVYVTIVTAYLLVSIGLLIIFEIIARAIPMEQHQVGFGTLVYALLAPIFLIWKIATISVSIAGGIALFYRRKFGFDIAMAALVLMTITLPFAVTSFYSLVADDVIVNYGRDPLNMVIRDYIFPILSYSILAVSITMFPFMILGWKRAVWR